MKRFALVLLVVGLGVALGVVVWQMLDGGASKDDASDDRRARDPGEAEPGVDLALVDKLLELQVDRVPYSRGLRLMEAHGGGAAFETAEFGRLLEAALESSRDDVGRAMRIIALAVRLDRREMAPTLDAMARDASAPAALRLAALDALVMLRPDDPASELRDLVARIGELDTATRDAVLLRTTLRDVGAAKQDLETALGVADERIQEIEAGGLQSDEMADLGAMGHLQSTIKRHLLELKRAEGIEARARGEGAEVLVREFVEYYTHETRRERAFHAILRLDARDEAIRLARAPAKDAETHEVVALLKLRDRLQDQLSDKELGMLEKSMPAPPVPMAQGMPGNG